MGLSLGRRDLRQSWVGQREDRVTGGDRGKSRRQQTIFGLGARVSREQGIVGGGFAPAQEPGSQESSTVGWGRQSGAMGGGERNLSPGFSAALLESQDAQRDRCGEPQRAEPSQGSSTRHDVCRKPRASVKRAT